MNGYDDLIRRVHFMVRELVRNGHDPDAYHLVISDLLLDDVIHAMPASNRFEYFCNPGRLLGFPVARAEERLGLFYLALRHEVQG